MLLSVRSFGKFLILFSLVSTIVGCSPLTNKAKSTTNTANLTLDEKPEILDISASVIWDGEQTLGGNWISHPNVDSPERVLIKNISNGKSIVGAIFQQTKKMETETAVISSDAARALGISKNNQTKVQIIAVRVAEGTPPTLDVPSPNAANTQFSLLQHVDTHPAFNPDSCGTETELFFNHTRQQLKNIKI